jgi:two-component system, OmpR family, response regulator ChvI
MSEADDRWNRGPDAQGRTAPRADTPAQQGARIVVIDDDDLVRESLRQNLSDAGFEVRAFASGEAGLDHLCSSEGDDLVLLDWKMPGMDGIEVLRRLRQAGLEVPVIFLTALTDQNYEQAALQGGAVDFIDKTRGFPILLRRVNLILDGVKASAANLAAASAPVFRHGALELRRDAGRAFWQGQEVPLSFNEFRMIDLLATQPGRDVPYRALYDLVHGPGFVAGCGQEGYRSNVRAFIKRIRDKFRAIDEGWDLIENYSSFGYRWREGEAPPVGNGEPASTCAAGKAVAHLRLPKTDPLSLPGRW